MAISGKEVEFVGPGIRTNQTDRGSYVQNMVYYNENWETRKGFGVVGEWDSTLSKYTLDPSVLADVEGYHSHLGSYLMTTDFGNRQIISVFYIKAWNSQNNLELSPATSGIAGRAPLSNSRRLPTYVISIYDITARQRWEEAVYTSTSERTLSNIEMMPTARGYYETNRNESFGALKYAPSTDQISFTEFNDILFFGNESMGVYYYKPASFIGNVSKAIDTIPTTSSSAGYSESSIVSKLILADGVYSDAYGYYSNISNVIGLTKLHNRLVYITGENMLFFADENYPASIVSGHTLNIPSEYAITSAKELNGNLLIFTESETYLYQPTSGFFVNEGQLIKISESIGCLSLNSVTKFENTMVWVDKNGVYLNGGDLAIQNISQNIKQFFTNYLANPLSSFQTEQGDSQVWLYEQPRLQHNLEPDDITIAYSNKLKAILITIPKERITLVYNENKEWSIWNYDSMAFSVGNDNKVGVRQFMDCQQIIADDKGMYAIGLDNREENKITRDEAEEWDRVDPAGTLSPVSDPRAQRFNTCFITEYGRGGGIDRSIDDEDYRYGIGEWFYNGLSVWSTGPNTAGPWIPAGVLINQSAARSEYYDMILGRPERVKKGFLLKDFEFHSDGILVPVQIRIPRSLTGVSAVASMRGQAQNTPRTQWINRAINKLTLLFDFDRSHWVPVMDPGTAKINLIFKTPNELLAGGMGNYEVNYVMNSLGQAQLWNPATNLLDAATGSQFRFAWDGNKAANPAKTANFNDLGLTFTMRHFCPGSAQNLTTGLDLTEACMPVTSDEIHTLFWIPFLRAADTEAVSGMFVNNMKSMMVTSTITAGAPDYSVYRSNNYNWNFSSLGSDSDSLHYNDNVAQGVDWAYCGAPIGLGEGQQMKARGLYSQIQSHGMSTEHFLNGWSPDHANVRNYRLFNSVVAADGAKWQGQIIDMPTIANAPQPKAIDISDSKTVRNFPVANNPQEESIRTRIRDSTTQLKYKVFGNAACTWAQLHGAPDPDEGSVLIDDPQFGTIAESTSTRGEWVNWMFFGYVLDKAEKLILKSAKAVIRRVSGRRRTGHSGGQAGVADVQGPL